MPVQVSNSGSNLANSWFAAWAHPPVDHPGNLLVQFDESPDQQRGIRKCDGMPNPSVAYQEAIAALGKLIINVLWREDLPEP
jgi:hypothetical protein